MVLWYLAIREVRAIENFFGQFLPFGVAVTLVGVPLSVAIGRIHLKLSPACRSEIDIGVEADPYYYKLPPGYNREVYAPLYLEMLMQLKQLLDPQRLLSDEEKSRIETKI